MYHGTLHHLLLLFLLLSPLTPPSPPVTTFATITPNIAPDDGPANFSEGNRLFQLKDYQTASIHYWRAVLSDSQGQYTIQNVFEMFVRCYAVRDRTIDAFLFVARESVMRGQMDMARVYLERAEEMDESHWEVREIKMLLEMDGGGGGGDDGGGRMAEAEGSSSSKSRNPEATSNELELAKNHYEQGTNHFNNKNYASAAQSFSLACPLSDRYPALRVACTNAIYCRTNVLDWGHDGSTFQSDMETIVQITKREIAEYRSVIVKDDAESGRKTTIVSWKKPTSVHPHMMLGYPLNPLLKRYVAESYALTDEIQARYDSQTQRTVDLPPDLPYINDDNRRNGFVLDAVDPSFRLRIAFLSGGFSSKAVLYLSHDMFRFFDRRSVELHVFSTGEPDDERFIRYTMRGVDWRERVRTNVDYFHDVRHLRDRHIDLARRIYQEKIHILIEWDGYARQGIRAQGVFGLRPAPIQVLHQEYLGTSGGNVDYIVTDRVVSPEGEGVEDHYSEKFLYMPDHFFSKGHAVQSEVRDPTLTFRPRPEGVKEYVPGTGTPQENRCGVPFTVGQEYSEPEASFVYCNFNKFLKANPETIRSWITILRNVPNSLLCLLENPSSAIPNLLRFVRETADATSTSPSTSDANDLISRIRFLPWEANPFDHQARNADLCNAVLDSYPYNGHTTAQDALYGGVPIVTRSDGIDMASRVTASANVVLGLEELNADGGTEEYEQIAIRLGTDGMWFRKVRERLVGTCLKRDPMHPYWDVGRYVGNLEWLLGKAWEGYLLGREVTHLYLSNKERDEGGGGGTVDGGYREEL